MLACTRLDEILLHQHELNQHEASVDQIQLKLKRMQVRLALTIPMEK
ncbi:hypothetical protein SynROS8604_01586 [Synechococcus sp. ROS8604]|nr:hypothetical protein SynROS8604_01586 [Synechococcus sp. ROS8604]